MASKRNGLQALINALTGQVSTGINLWGTVKLLVEIAVKAQITIYDVDHENRAQLGCLGGRDF